MQICRYRYIVCMRVSSVCMLTLLLGVLINNTRTTGNGPQAAQKDWHPDEPSRAEQTKQSMDNHNPIPRAEQQRGPMQQTAPTPGDERQCVPPHPTQKAATQGTDHPDERLHKSKGPVHPPQSSYWPRPPSVHQDPPCGTQDTKHSPHSLGGATPESLLVCLQHWFSLPILVAWAIICNRFWSMIPTIVVKLLGQGGCK